MCIDVSLNSFSILNVTGIASKNQKSTYRSAFCFDVALVCVSTMVLAELLCSLSQHHVFLNTIAISNTIEFKLWCFIEFCCDHDMWSIAAMPRLNSIIPSSIEPNFSHSEHANSNELFEIWKIGACSRISNLPQAWNCGYRFTERLNEI